MDLSTVAPANERIYEMIKSVVDSSREPSHDCCAIGARNG
jgi:hypothetical protein